MELRRARGRPQAALATPMTAAGLENRLRPEDRSAAAANFSIRQTVRQSAPWLSLAVISRTGGRWRSTANLDGCLRTTANGFEDRGARVHSGPLASVPVQP